MIDAPKRRLRWLWGIAGLVVAFAAFAGYFWFGPGKGTFPIPGFLETAAPGVGAGDVFVTDPGVSVVEEQEAAEGSEAPSEVPAAPTSETGPQPRPRATRPSAPAQVEPQAQEVPQAPGQLFINSRPWGRVYVDGEFVGNTPQAGLTIAAGAHTIRVVRDGYETYEAEIEIFSGRQRRITDIVLRPRQP